MPRALEGPPVLLFDGTCGLCHGFVRFMLRRDRHRRLLRLAPLESSAARLILAHHPEATGIDSVVWVEPLATPDEKALTRSDAVLRALEYLGMPWSLLRIFRAVPRPLRDWVYDYVARKRYGWFGRYDVCPLPTPEEQARYL